MGEVTAGSSGRGAGDSFNTTHGLAAGEQRPQFAGWLASKVPFLEAHLLSSLLAHLRLLGCRRGLHDQLAFLFTKGGGGGGGGRAASAICRRARPGRSCSSACEVAAQPAYLCPPVSAASHRAHCPLTFRLPRVRSFSRKEYSRNVMMGPCSGLLCLPSPRLAGSAQMQLDSGTQERRSRRQSVHAQLGSKALACYACPPLRSQALCTSGGLVTS